MTTNSPIEAMEHHAFINEGIHKLDKAHLAPYPVSVFSGKPGS